MRSWNGRPRANHQDTPRLTAANVGIGVWGHLTTQLLETVLESGYFDLVQDGVERHDRIIVTASAESTVPEHATLVVTRSEPGHGVDVAVLHRMKA